MSLKLFINIPLADGDSTSMKYMRGKILPHPLPFKDTDSQTSAVAPFEVSDSVFYCSERFSKNFSQFS